MSGGWRLGAVGGADAVPGALRDRGGDAEAVVRLSRPPTWRPRLPRQRHQEGGVRPHGGVSSCAPLGAVELLDPLREAVVGRPPM